MQGVLTFRRRCARLGVAGLVAILFTTALGILFAGLAMAEAPVNVTFWHSLGGDHQKVLNQLVDEFNKEHTGIVVKAEYQGNHGALSQKLIAAVAAKAPPTLSLVFNNWTAAFVEGEAIVPIEKFAKDPNVGLSAAEINDFFLGFRKANTWNGRWYTMPINKSDYVLYYNADLLKKAGVGVPKTWSELQKAAKAVAEKTGVKGLAVRPDVDTFGIFLQAASGDWLDGNGRAAFHGSEGVAALQFLADLVRKDQSTYYHEGYLDEEFNKGKIAMFFATVATIPWISKEISNWGTAPIPAGKVQVTPASGTDIAIFAKSSQEEQKAAWEFIKWFVSPEIGARWAIETGYLPVRKSTLAAKSYQAHIKSATEKHSAGVDQLDVVTFDPGVSAWFDARTYISDAVKKALIQGASPQAALAEAAERTNKSLGK